MTCPTRFSKKGLQTILYNISLSHPCQESVYLVPANACPVVPAALLAAGRRIEFIDIDSKSYCMDIQHVFQRLDDTQKAPVGGVIFIRTYGVLTDRNQFFESIKQTHPNLMVIDDRCLCRPDTDGVNIDLQGADLTLYSTGYAKYCDLGMGGFGHLKATVAYHSHQRDYQPSDLESFTSLYKASIAQKGPIPISDENPSNFWTALNWLDTAVPARTWFDYATAVEARCRKVAEHKKRINALYESVIPAQVQLDRAFHHWRFQIIVPQKMRLLERFQQAGLFAGDHFYPASLLFHGIECPQSDTLYNDIVNLFNDFYITPAQAEETAQIVYEHVRRYG